MFGRLRATSWFMSHSSPTSWSLSSSSSVVEQPWACFTWAVWPWKTQMSRKWFQEHLLEHLSFCVCVGQQIADSPFSFYCLSLRWDRKNNPEPWNKMEPTQQYKVLMVIYYLHTYLLIQAPHSLTFFHNSILSEAYFFEGTYTSRLLSCGKVHVALSHWLYVFVYVSSCLQLTWTTPSWRRTGLISNSSRLCSG